MEKDLMCTCGDTESQHVDNCEQCFVSGCGCREFEEEDGEAEDIIESTDTLEEKLEQLERL